MEIIADMHCHTVASGHAYSTVVENARVAKEKKMWAIAITDHTGVIPDSPSSWYFDNLKVLPDKIFGVKIFKGIETNVVDKNGNIDLPSLKIDLDWVIASIHAFSFQKEHGITECTKAWIGVANNPIVDVIGHSGTVGFEYDFEKVIPIFKKNNKIVEINASSYRSRPGSEKNCIRIAELCKKYKVPVIVNSDAHFCDNVGDFDMALKVLESVNFPKELVVNSNIEHFQKYTNLV
ncbi:MAG: phosphatase [Candidatus Improbicoccus pseudotrichonymphae]|uniref:Phosphatase n=1 Tax=Candidatus Improbicoccus pseudotrichonymphae TaxID=3033792 RepID=A0AA48KY97_9FIRM|nr:MAG: phosphatase [Candidatus Improbicoccus pseudotrichonymphae]